MASGERPPAHCELAGSHVVAALALGARAVLIGRPYPWGLAVDGEAGVPQALEQLRSEVALAMALCGRRQVADIDAALIAAQPGRPVTGEGGWP